MLAPKIAARGRASASSGSNFMTIILVVGVLVGVLGWAIYDSQVRVRVRHVPTETIIVPPVAPRTQGENSNPDGLRAAAPT